MVLPAREATCAQARAAETLGAAPTCGLWLLPPIGARVLPLLLPQPGNRLRVGARRATGQDERERVAEGVDADAILVLNPPRARPSPCATCPPFPGACPTRSRARAPPPADVPA